MQSCFKKEKQIKHKYSDQIAKNESLLLPTHSFLDVRKLFFHNQTQRKFDNILLSDGFLYFEG